MNHIVTLSLVIFSLTQMSAAHQHGIERLRVQYERADALTRSILTITVSFDDHEQQADLLNTADSLLPQIASIAAVQKYQIAHNIGAGTTGRESVNNNSP